MSEMTINPQQDGDEAWALGINGRWRLVRVIGDGFLDNIEVSNVLRQSDSWKLNTFVGRTGSS